jgi:hypothetical protein
MKDTRSFLNRLATLGTAAVVMAWAGALCAQSAYQGTAKVLSVKGAARYTADNVNWLPLKVGDVVRPGAVIQTASSSQVDLVLTDREEGGPQPTLKTMAYRPEGEARANLVRMYENTTLGVDKLARTETGADVVSETQLDLRAGKIFGSVKKLSGASTYDVKIPNGVAGIRGTIYTLTSSGVVNVLVGSVVMKIVAADNSIVTKEVSTGQMFDPATGLVTSIPDFNQVEMVKSAEKAKIAKWEPMTYAIDHTVFSVSPTSPLPGSEGPGTP